MDNKETRQEISSVLGHDLLGHTGREQGEGRGFIKGREGTREGGAHQVINQVTHMRVMMERRDRGGADRKTGNPFTKIKQETQS